MRSTGYLLGITGAVLSAFVLTVAAAEPELIPREVLFGNASRARPRISPEGERLAYLAPYEGVMNVWTKTLGATDDRPVTVDPARPVKKYWWGHDGEHIFFLRDDDGDENDHLYRVPLAGGAPVDLTPYEGAKVKLLKYDKRFPEVAAIAMNRREASAFDVYALDLRTGEAELLTENRGDIYGWDVDAELAVRGANVVLPDGGEQYLVRDDASSPWRVLVEWDYEESLTSGSVAFGGGDWVYLLDSREVNAARLTRRNIRTGETEVVGGNPQYDVQSYLFHPDTHEIQAYAVYRARREWTVVDEAVREDFEALARLDPGDFYVENRDHADRLWVVRYDRDDASRQYYLYDRRTREGTFLFEERPALGNYALAAMEPISFKARDGLEIHGYATFPPGKPRASLPTVLYVHGGPHVRDRWGFHGLTQGLANRGYLVLRINYRGSSGYGKAYLNAGRKEWGGAMQEDLTDAVAWAVAQGWADAERVAIMGGSYGGYAALAGATFTPDLYACAVAAMGPSNLITFLETIPPYWKPFLARMKLRVGDPETEADFLRARSPLFHVDRIRIPMLLVYGANDARVKLSEGEQIREAMEAKGIDYEYLVFADEGHGFQQPHNRLRYVAAAEAFLAKHLGGRYEPYENNE